MSEVIGYTVVKNGDRFEATRAVKNAIQHRFGALDKDIAKEEQLFKLHDFATLEEAEKAIGKFIKLYNNKWMLERLGYI